jgi:hypothetical protein
MATTPTTIRRKHKSRHHYRYFDKFTKVIVNRCDICNDALDCSDNIESQIDKLKEIQDDSYETQEKETAADTTLHSWITLTRLNIAFCLCMLLQLCNYKACSYFQYGNPNSQCNNKGKFHRSNCFVKSNKNYSALCYELEITNDSYVMKLGAISMNPGCCYAAPSISHLPITM